MKALINTRVYHPCEFDTLADFYFFAVMWDAEIVLFDEIVIRPSEYSKM